jgi:hypothetical protein
MAQSMTEKLVQPLDLEGQSDKSNMISECQRALAACIGKMQKLGADQVQISTILKHAAAVLDQADPTIG